MLRLQSHMQAAILAEESRVTEYLHASSRDLLMGAVVAELVGSVMESLLSKDTGADNLFHRQALDGAPRRV